MNRVEEQLNTQKTMYKEIFLKSVDEIQKRLDTLKPEGVNGDLLDVYAKNSFGQKWQREALALLEGEISKDVFRKLQEIL